MRDKITEEGRQAARTIAQWELGDPRWADRLLTVATASDPKIVARMTFVNHPNDFNKVWAENKEPI